MNNNIGILISGCKGKRGFEFFFQNLKIEQQEAINKAISLGGTLIHIVISVCNSSYSIKDKEDFPPKNVRCSCGKHYMVKYED